MLRTLSQRLFTNYNAKPIIQHFRFLSHYPIDETIFGLNDDQIKVSVLLFICVLLSFPTKYFVITVTRDYF